MCNILILSIHFFISAFTILVNGGGVMEGGRLVPLPSLEILLRLTFPPPSARLDTTERFEAIYPLLKEVALSPERAGGGRCAMNNLFTFALTLTGEKGNPVGLTKEATSIAIRSLSENVDCFEHWDHPEASVVFLKKLVDEWNPFLRLSTSPSDTLTVTVNNRTIESFRGKNKRAIAEGGASCSLYKEADKYCTLISWRLRLPLVSGLTAGLVVTVSSAAASIAATAAAICIPCSITSALCIPCSITLSMLFICYILVFQNNLYLSILLIWKVTT